MLYNVGCFYATVGKTALALDHLERAMELGMRNVDWLLTDPDLESVRGLRKRFVDVVSLRGEKLCLIQGCVWRRLDHAEDHALILLGRQLLLGEKVKGQYENRHDGPQRKHYRPVIQRAGQQVRISIADGIESAIDPSGKTAFRVSRAQKPRPHHRRESERDNTRHDDRACQGECELAKQGAGEPALQSDGRIYRRQGYSHRNDRAHQLAGCRNGGVKRTLPELQMPLYVLDHDNGVVNYQTD